MLPHPDELRISFARSSGPGGQNVNKVASKVLLRWNPGTSQSVPATVKNRLLEMLRRRLTKEGDLLLVSQRYREQPRNIDDCKEKLRALIQQAVRPRKKRKPTKPTKASKERRLSTKRKRSQTKSGRQPPREE